MIRPILLITCLAISTIGGLSSSATPPGGSGTIRNSLPSAEDREHAAQTITVPELQNHVQVLADDTFEGRKAGARGGQVAAGFLRQWMQRSLEPAGEQGFDQPFGANMRNLLGQIPGSDPELRHEVILIGAHYDHVGYGSENNSFGPFGYVHNGADDNASGTAVLLELMDAMHQMKTPPRRTIVFAFWDGEEDGMLGSRHWVQNSTIDRDRLRLAINLDMVGRLRSNKMEVIASRSLPGLRRWISNANQTTRLQLDFKWTIEDNSDHYSFLEQQIPSVMFHTGLHDDYHRPSDDVHLLNVDGMQQVAQVVFHSLLEVANSQQLPDFWPHALHETEQHRQVYEANQIAYPARFGISWQEDASQGAVIQSVEANSPAHFAGLQNGDIIQQLDGRDVTDSNWLQLELMRATSVRLRISRPTESAWWETNIQLQGRPCMWGMFWREDSAEPGCVTVSRIISGSPADEAGLRIRDRIYQHQGRPFEDGNQLGSWMQVDEDHELLIERSGVLQSVTIRAAVTSPSNSTDSPVITEPTLPVSIKSVPSRRAEEDSSNSQQIHSGLPK
ncbi:MAG: M20/M25/M40 family metallo-hydrolase [Planctomycetales bacterium]|nr:M20/M25/M40 family metallo-hydrolase [Planctomycetales bacterium]